MSQFTCPGPTCWPRRLQPVPLAPVRRRDHSQSLGHGRHRVVAGTVLGASTLLTLSTLPPATTLFASKTDTNPTHALPVFQALHNLTSLSKTLPFGREIFWTVQLNQPQQHSL